MGESSRVDSSAAYLFKYLLLANMFQYMEAGAVPALLLALAHSFRMQPGEQGLLGAVVYLSLSLGGPLAGFLLRRYDHKMVLVSSIGTNLLLTFLWAMTPIDRSYSTTLFISIRFIMGFTQCIVCVFLPLWTMENAPKTKRTIWMSYLQASVPLGVMMGYIVASLMITSCTSTSVSKVDSPTETCFGLVYWRWPFLVEIFFLLPLFVLLQFVPKAHISVVVDSRRQRTNKNGSVLAQEGTTNIASPHEEDSNPSIEEGNEDSLNLNRSNLHLDTAVSNVNTNANNNIYNNANHNNHDNNNNIHHHINNHNGTARIRDDDSDDYSKYDDEFIKMKAQLRSEEKKQRNNLQRHSMSASMYDSMASINVTSRASDHFSFVNSEDYPIASRRQDLSSNSRYGSVGLEDSEKILSKDADRNGITTPAIDHLGQVNLTRNQGSFSNMSELSDSSSKATQWIFSFVPLNWKSIWKTSQSFLKRSPSLSIADLENGTELRPVQVHSSPDLQSLKVKSGSDDHQLTSSKTTASKKRNVRRCSRFVMDQQSADEEKKAEDPEGSTVSTLSSRGAKKKTFQRSGVPKSYSLRYESLRELPALSRDFGPWTTASNRQRSCTIPLSPEGKSHDLERETEVNGSRLRNSLALQMMSPLFDWRNRRSAAGSESRSIASGSGAWDDRGRRRNIWPPRRTSQEGSSDVGYYRHSKAVSMLRIRSKSVDQIPPTPSAPDEFQKQETTRNVGFGPKDLSPTEEAVSFSQHRKKFLKVNIAAEAIAPSAIAPTPLSQQTNGHYYRGQMMQLSGKETDRDKLLRNLMISKSSSDSNLSNLLEGRVGTSRSESPRESTKSGAFSRSGAIGEDGQKDPFPVVHSSEEYYSNSESEEEWSGLDNDISRSVASSELSPAAETAAWNGWNPFAGRSAPSANTAYDMEGQPLLFPSVQPTSPVWAFLARAAKDAKKAWSYCVKSLISVKALLALPVYRNLLGAVTALYFTVTGVQYWGTKYLSIVLAAPMPLVNLLFIVCAATGPTSGVFFGGWLIDQFGGFKGPKQRVVSLELCTGLGILACLFSLPITMVKNIFVAVACLWMVLFFGGSTLPACSGIIVSIVPRRHRPTSSPLSLVIFNLFGYFLSLILSGYLMQYLQAGNGSCSPVCAMTWGFRLILFWSFLSLFFLFSALQASYLRVQGDRSDP